MNAALHFDELPTLRLRTLRRMLAGRPIIALQRTMPIAIARALFAESKLPFAAVVDHGGLLVGTIAWSALRMIEDGLTIADVMDDDIVTIEAESDLDDAALMLQKHGVDRIVVVGAKGEMVGIVDLDDVRE